MNIQQAKPGTIRASLRYPAFRWLLGGLAVSQLGDWLLTWLIALVYERTHSALWAGITTAARVVPVVAPARWAGWWPTASTGAGP